MDDGGSYGNSSSALPSSVLWELLFGATLLSLGNEPFLPTYKYKENYPLRVLKRKNKPTEADIDIIQGTGLPYLEHHFPFRLNWRL
jgi:hypothetical protein